MRRQNARSQRNLFLLSIGADRGFDIGDDRWRPSTSLLSGRLFSRLYGPLFLRNLPGGSDQLFEISQLDVQPLGDEFLFDHALCLGHGDESRDLGVDLGDTRDISVGLGRTRGLVGPTAIQ